ncbi:MAG: universal stress protein [Bacteroidales bacterium]|jgi:nucleotide-binding universal stress UspA family protein|nr:universal stress protein [Bacteroidales bacterium]NPV35631.1 universal stress protein [Bacteroidales bacterium]
MNRKSRIILVPVDFEKASLTALEQTFNLARLLKLEIVALYVFEETGAFARFLGQDRSTEIVARISADLEELARQTEEKSGVKVTAMIEKGKPHDVILKKADELNALLIFMGTTNSTDEEIVGTTTHKVVRSAKCPVITVRGVSYHDGCRTILLPLDLTAESRQKISWAVEIARLYKASIKTISVVTSSDPEIKQTLAIQQKQAKNFIEKLNIPCAAELIDAQGEKPVKIILDYIEQHPEIDLVVIMTQQELGIVDYFLDSEAQQIIRHSKVPVMSVVPKEIGFTSIRIL